MSLLDGLLSKVIRHGELIVRTESSERRFGTPDPNRAPVVVRFTDKAAARAVALNPALGAGEMYMDGRMIVESGDILSLLDLVSSNINWDHSNKTRLGMWKVQKWTSRIDEFNSAIRSRKNVAHHYDLSDRLYDLFLDADRQYSCAYFTDPDNSLEQAQGDKLAHIAAKLLLEPGMRVLEIGCGWGGLALYLNKVAGVDVTGITLSSEQLAVAQARAKALGVSDQVRFELMDYRAVKGQFDRIVSIGMFEHVGRPNYGRFFETVRDRLSPDGVALLHSIARADGPGVTDPWTRKYIFPGGYSPALSEIVPAIEKSWLWITDIEVLRLHYAYTLQHWYDRVQAERTAIEVLYDARFFRMWTFYLAGAIGAFRHDGHMNVQIQLARQRDAVPVTRDYMAEAERRYRALAKASGATANSIVNVG